MLYNVKTRVNKGVRFLRDQDALGNIWHKVNVGSRQTCPLAQALGGCDFARGLRISGLSPRQLQDMGFVFWTWPEKILLNWYWNWSLRRTRETWL